MCGRFGGDHAFGGFVLMAAVVGVPTLADHETAEAVPPCGLRPGVAVAVVAVGAPSRLGDIGQGHGVGVFGLAVLAQIGADGGVDILRRRKGVGCGAQSDDGLAGLEKAVDGRHLVVGQDAPAGENNHQVGAVEGLGSRDVGVDVRVDDSRFRIDREQDGAAKTVMVRENFGKLRQSFFRAVLLVAGDENDVLAPARPGGAFVGQDVRRGGRFGGRRRLGGRAAEKGGRGGGKSDRAFHCRLFSLAELDPA